LPRTPIPAYLPPGGFPGQDYFPFGVTISLQQRLVKTGGRLVRHARYYWMMLAEGHLTRTRFAAMLRRIALLPLPAS